MATEDLLALRLLGRHPVSPLPCLNMERRQDTDSRTRASVACAIRVAFAAQAGGTNDATMAQYHVVTLLSVFPHLQRT